MVRCLPDHQGSRFLFFPGMNLLALSILVIVLAVLFVRGQYEDSL